MDKPVYTITNESVVVLHQGTTHTIKRGAANFSLLCKALLAEDWAAVPSYLTIKSGIEQWAEGKFTVQKGVVSFEGTALPVALNRRIVEMASQGTNPQYLFRFWEKLQRNPSWRSVEMLFDFLQHEGIPITEEGDILAYKGLNSNFTDKHTGTVDNKPGVINKMPRNKISDDPNVACHVGYHVGSLKYAKEFAKGGPVVICRVDPADVVCVPYDYSQQKMRTCEYKVEGLLGAQLPSTTYTEEDRGDKHLEELATKVDAPVEEDPDLPTAKALTEVRQDVVNVPAAKKSQAMTEGFKEIYGKPEPNSLKDLAKEQDKETIKQWRLMDDEGHVGLVSSYSLDQLRKYATYRCKIIGASKIRGGKLSLVEIILDTRESLKENK